MVRVRQRALQRAPKIGAFSSRSTCWKSNVLPRVCFAVGGSSLGTFGTRFTELVVDERNRHEYLPREGTPAVVGGAVGCRPEAASRGGRTAPSSVQVITGPGRRSPQLRCGEEGALVDARELRVGESLVDAATCIRLNGEQRRGFPVRPDSFYGECPICRKASAVED
jgi:hypothetical protein